MTAGDAQAAVAQLHRLIEQRASELGPWLEDDEGEPLPDQPVPGAQLVEWVLVTAWRDPATGDHFVNRWPSEDLPAYRENGLLYEALHMD